MIITDNARIDCLVNELLDGQNKWLISLDGEDYQMFKNNVSSIKAVRVDAEDSDPNLPTDLASELMQLESDDKTAVLIYVCCGKGVDLTMSQLKTINDAVHLDIRRISYKTGVCRDVAVPDGHVVILAIIGYR